MSLLSLYKRTAIHSAVLLLIILSLFSLGHAIERFNTYSSVTLLSERMNSNDKFEGLFSLPQYSSDCDCQLLFRIANFC